MAERWTDDRLDDRFESIDRTLQRLDRVAGDMGDVSRQLRDAMSDMAECRRGVETLRTAIVARAEERARERIAALEQAERAERTKELERKEDRRYQQKTLLAVAALILTGVGILLSVLT